MIFFLGRGDYPNMNHIPPFIYFDDVDSQVNKTVEIGMLEGFFQSLIVSGEGDLLATYFCR